MAPPEDIRETEKPGSGELTGSPLMPHAFHSYVLPPVDPEPVFPRISILGIPLHTISTEEAILAIMDRLYADSPSHVCFVNAHCANLAYRDSAYSHVLHTATFNFPDGVGLRLAGELLGRRIPHNVNGTDLFPLLCAALEETDAGVFLFGGQPGIAEGVRDWIGTHYPDVHVSGWRHGYFSPEEEPILLRQIADSGVRLLLVALGTRTRCVDSPPSPNAWRASGDGSWRLVRFLFGPYSSRAVVVAQEGRRVVVPALSRAWSYVAALYDWQSAFPCPSDTRMAPAFASKS